MPASFDGIDTTQQLGSATYNVALSLATYTNPIPSTSFTYSNWHTLRMCIQHRVHLLLV